MADLYDDERDEDRSSPIDDFNYARGKANQVRDTLNKIKNRKGESSDIEEPPEEKPEQNPENKGKDSGENKNPSEEGSNSVEKENSSDKPDIDKTNEDKSSDKSDKKDDRASDNEPKKKEEPSDKTSDPSKADTSNPQNATDTKPETGTQPGQTSSPVQTEGVNGGVQGTQATGTQVGTQAGTQAVGTAGAEATAMGSADAAAAGSGAAGASAGAGAGAGAGAAAGGTAAAASNPVGWIILALAAAYAVGKDLAKGDDSKIVQFTFCSIGTLIGLPLLVLLVMLMPVMAFCNMVVNFATDVSNTGHAFIWTFTQTEKVALFTEMSDSHIWDGDLYATVTDPTQAQIDKGNVENYKLLIDMAVYKAFANLENYNNEDDSNVKNLQDFIERPTDYIATTWMEMDAALTGHPPFFNIGDSQYDYYLSLDYPYYVDPSTGKNISIGEYLDAIEDGSELTSDSLIIKNVKNFKNNDLNYAEILSVFSQAAEFNEFLTLTEEERNSYVVSDGAPATWSFSEFYDMMTSNDVNWLLFECEFGGKDHKDYIYRVVHNSEFGDGKTIFYTLDTVDTSNLSGYDEIKTYSNLTDLHDAAWKDYEDDAAEWYKEKIDEVNSEIMSSGLAGIAEGLIGTARNAIVSSIEAKLKDVSGRIDTFMDKFRSNATNIASFFEKHPFLGKITLGLSYDVMMEGYSAYKDHITEIANDPDSPTFTHLQEMVDDMTSEWPDGYDYSYPGSIGYFYTMKVTPYGLKELYTIVDDFVLDGSKTFTPTSDFWQDTFVENNDITPRPNIYYLDQEEEQVRCYLGYDPGEKADTNNGAEFFGPAYNDETRNGNESGLTATLMRELPGGIVSGRSPISYLELSIQAESGDEIARYSRYTNPSEYNGAFNPTGESVILNMADLHVSQTLAANAGREGSWKYRLGESRYGRLYYGGCIDCSYLACANYYRRCTGHSDIYPVSILTDRDDGTKGWMSVMAGGGGGAFSHTTFLRYVAGDIGSSFNAPSAAAPSPGDDSALQDIVNSITEGRPVIFYLYNSSNSDRITFKEPTNRGNTTLTTTAGHWMTIYGYDESYFYVLDSNKANAGNPALKYSFDFFMDVINGDTSRNSMSSSNGRVKFAYISYNGSWTPQYAINSISDSGNID